MPARPCNVLFLCTGNSARSVMAEAMLNVLGQGRFHAFSAGSFPSGSVQPIAAELARAFGYHKPLRSKSWDEYAQLGAPALDIVITVCDNAAAEVCPIWPGQPITAHWGVPDPASVRGGQQEQIEAFQRAWNMLRQRVDRLLTLAPPADGMSRSKYEAMQRALRDIGASESARER